MKGFIKHILIILLVFKTIGATGQNTEKLPDIINGILSKCIINGHVAPALTQLKSNKFNSAEIVKPGIIVGFDMTYYFKKYKKFNAGISIGLNYSYYRTQHSFNYNDSLWITDIDNDSVHLFENGNNLNEMQKTGFINIPLLIHIDYTLYPWLDLYLNAGAYYSIVISKKYNATMNYTAYGYYPKYNVVLSDTDVPDSPYFYPTNKSMTYNNKLKLKNNIGIQLAVGVKYKLTSRISLTAGFNTYLGMRDISKYNDEIPFTLVNSGQHINTLMDRNDKIKANAYGIELGIAFNLFNTKSPNGDFWNFNLD